MKSLFRVSAICLLATAMLGIAAPTTDAQNVPPQGQSWPSPPGNPKVVTTNSGLQYYDMVVGKGPQPPMGSKVQVHYTGWLLSNKTKFDSSLDRGEPFEFTLGARQVIAGWDEGVSTMKVGSRRRLVVPANLGYGATGTPGGPIPPNATLVFDVQLLKF